MARNFTSASRNPAHKPPSREHDQVRSVRLLVALALTLILAGVANTAAQSVNFQPTTTKPEAEGNMQAIFRRVVGSDSTAAAGPIRRVFGIYWLGTPDTHS